MAGRKVIVGPDEFGNPSEFAQVGSKPVLIDSGTVAVASSSQNPATVSIAEPSTEYQNFLFIFNNGTGQTISNIQPQLSNVTVGGTTGTLYVSAGKTPTAANASTTALGIAVWSVPNGDPYIFIKGNVEMVANLSAATTATGTIDWELYGYN